jgi:LCP family protein required for cell wall assembly
MPRFRREIRYLFLIALLVGCSFPAIPGGPTANPAQVTLIMDVPGATATPTPFQPIPPTPMAPVGGQPPGTEIPPGEAPTPTLASPPPEAPEQQTIEQPFGQVNILLLGSDRRPGGSNFRTDTIILVTLNSDLSQVNITSFPRDLWVTLPNYGPGRINTAWTFGGYSMLSKTFSHNFGIKPDYYALIDFSSFKRVIDSLGGLNVHVAQPLSDYRAGYWVTIPKGEVHMDADTALWYSRSRKTSNDFARNRRQQEVLQATFEKLLSLDAVRRAPEFYDIYKESVTTDIGLVQILTWLPLAARIAENSNIHHYYISPADVYDWITPDGAMVLVPNMNSVMQVIRKSQNIQ